jgi:hypothetical protein
MLSQLVNAKITVRYTRSLRYQLMAAKLPVHPDLDDFEWGETSL